MVPGILLVLLFSVYAWVSTSARAAQRAAGRHAAVHAGAEDRGPGPRVAVLGIVIAIGYAMYGGLATPSEVAALSAVLALALVMVIYRQWRLADQWRIFRETVRESTMILMIIGAAAVFSYMLSLLYVTQSAAQWMVDLELEPLGAAARDQRVPAGGRLLPAAGGDHPDGDADPHAGARGGQFRPDLVRGDPDHQHGSGADHAAGGPEPLRAEGRGARTCR